MTLHPGYNIVTEEIEETENEMGALSFFRALAADTEVETPVTVTNLTDLLYNATEDARAEILRELRQVLRQNRSLHSMDAVQFLVDGSIVEDNAMRVRIERSGKGIYLDIGELFVEEPTRQSPKHVTARK